MEKKLFSYFLFAIGWAVIISNNDRLPWLNTPTASAAIYNEEIPKIERSVSEPVLTAKRKAAPVSMQDMKTRGCVADGLFSGYGNDTDSAIALINRSPCKYLHRSIETWLAPPDFEEIDQYIAKINNPDMIYGMFIAEAINKKADYYYPDEDREFDFYDMCRPETQNEWGEHTCMPSFEKKEYRKYVLYITKRAMDLGVQTFLFGQIYHQDPSVKGGSEVPKILEEMRAYAKERKIDIVIGAQTNDISDEKYLRMFDYIEGGVGLRENGTIENGACFSRWWKKPGDWCWALLWNNHWSAKANNVFLHLDWRGAYGDDMSTFARMDKATRERTLDYLYKYFTQSGKGFMMPYLAVLYGKNNGCTGPEEGFYSPDNKYSCQDEEAISRSIRSNINPAQKAAGR